MATEETGAPSSPKRARTTEPWEAVNDAMDTIRTAAGGITDDGKIEAVDTLLGHLEHVAGFAREAHNAAEAGRPGDVTRRIGHATAASAAVEATASALRSSVGALDDLAAAVTAAVVAAKQAAASVPSFLGRAYDVWGAAEQERVNGFLGQIKDDSPLQMVLAIHQAAYPDDDDLKAIKMSTTTARVKLHDWWLTRNSSPAGAEAAFGSGPAAASFALTLDALCRRLKLWDGKPLENPVVAGLKPPLSAVPVSKAERAKDALSDYIKFGSDSHGDADLLAELTRGAKKFLGTEGWESNVGAIDGRIEEVLASQTGDWIGPAYNGADKTSGWWAWVSALKDLNKDERAFERPLYHLLQAALHDQHVKFMPRSGGGQTGRGRHNTKFQVRPFLFKGIISKGDVDFFGEGQSDTGGKPVGGQGWELKKPGALDWMSHRWQALVQCDSIMDSDRQVGYHVLTDLDDWYFIKATRTLDPVTGNLVVNVRRALRSVDDKRDDSLKEIARLLFAAWVLNSHPDNALDPKSELGKEVMAAGKGGLKDHNVKADATEEESGTGAGAGAEEGDGGGAGAGAGAEEGDGAGAGAGAGATPSETRKRAPEPGDPEHDRTPLRITPDLVPPGSLLEKLVAKHQNHMVTFGLFTHDEQAYMLAAMNSR